jgi:2,3-diketo-5-methylthiopentyl-1-phosphate enolase
MTFTQAHAFAKYRIQTKFHGKELIDEIAIGQSIGCWETSFVSEEILKEKVAKVIHVEEKKDYFDVTLAFPWSTWHGRLSWLVTLLFGKMSFYQGVQLNSVWFSKDCFQNELGGPQNTIESLRQRVGLETKSPLLMGILKPNVAMTAQQICDLYVEASEAGVHLLKDDEIRHDENEFEILNRVEKVTNEAAKRNLKTLYAVHLQISGTNYLDLVKKLENAGAHAFLINTWVAGIDVLQNVRKVTKLPILSHPALVGAFRTTEAESTIHPRVTMAQLIRAAGADLTLFPSPYGKLGLEKHMALEIARSASLQDDHWQIHKTIPVPSAGIKPEHAFVAKEDFGSDFVLNAGTGIFAGKKSIKENILEFRKNL